MNQQINNFNTNTCVYTLPQSQPQPQITIPIPHNNNTNVNTINMPPLQPVKSIESIAIVSPIPITDNNSNKHTQKRVRYLSNLFM